MLPEGSFVRGVTSKGQLPILVRRRKMTEKIYLKPNVLKALKDAMEEEAPDFHEECPLLEIAWDSELRHESIPGEESATG